ncbi:MAG: hypothetical protein WAT52_09300 [Chitinophagales bacterium]
MNPSNFSSHHPHPFGMLTPGRNWSAGSEYRFGFGGQEQVNEVSGDGNSYTAEFWQYDTRLGRRWNVDPMAHTTPSWSPYRAYLNNPIKYTDPTGLKESTDVKENEDGTYSVVGGDRFDGDNGIYKQNEEGIRGELIGFSSTPESFYYSDNPGKFGNNGWGGTIDPNDKSGRSFLRNLYEVDPSVTIFSYFAFDNRKYDFKATNGTDKPIYNSFQEYYRGMEIMNYDGKPVYASARDVGNIGAGLVMGRAGLSWEQARLGFDGLESFNANQLKTESTNTQYAELFGFKIGEQLFMKEDLSRLPGNGQLKSMDIKKNLVITGNLELK